MDMPAHDPQKNQLLAPWRQHALPQHGTQAQHPADKSTLALCQDGRCCLPAGSGVEGTLLSVFAGALDTASVGVPTGVPARNLLNQCSPLMCKGMPWHRELQVL